MEFDVEYREDYTRENVRKYITEDLLEDDTYTFYRDTPYPDYKRALFNFINENLSFETYEIDFKKANATRRAIIEISDKLHLVMEVEIWSMNTKDYTFKLEYNKLCANKEINFINSPYITLSFQLEDYTKKEFNIFKKKLDKYMKDKQINMSEY